MKKLAIFIMAISIVSGLYSLAFRERFATSRPKQSMPFGTTQTESLLILEAQTRDPDVRPELVYWQRPGSPKRFYLKDQAIVWDLFKQGTTLENIATRMGAPVQDISELIKVLLQKMSPRRSF